MSKCDMSKKELKEEFEEWFDKLAFSGHKSAASSCFWRDVLRGTKAELFKEYLRLSGYSEAILNGTSHLLGVGRGSSTDNRKDA